MNIAIILLIIFFIILIIIGVLIWYFVFYKSKNIPSVCKNASLIKQVPFIARNALVKACELQQPSIKYTKFNKNIPKPKFVAGKFTLKIKGNIKPWNKHTWYTARLISKNGEYGSPMKHVIESGISTTETLPKLTWELSDSSYDLNVYRANVKKESSLKLIGKAIKNIATTQYEFLDYNTPS